MGECLIKKIHTRVVQLVVGLKYIDLQIFSIYTVYCLSVNVSVQTDRFNSAKGPCFHEACCLLLASSLEAERLLQVSAWQTGRLGGAETAPAPE